jgi:hypothetical protein
MSDVKVSVAGVDLTEHFREITVEGGVSLPTEGWKAHLTPEQTAAILFGLLRVGWDDEEEPNRESEAE